MTIAIATICSCRMSVRSTGFFGQNFAWLVDRIGSLPAFLGIGVGTEVLAVIGLLTLFKKQGWM